MSCKVFLDQRGKAQRFPYRSADAEHLIAHFFQYFFPMNPFCALVLIGLGLAMRDCKPGIIRTWLDFCL
jgi:hypothetical protein